MQPQQPWYRTSYRRMLVDMHIADWDEAFLSKYDPAKMAELYQRAGVTGVMFYCQSHVGLCYWPTKTGRHHAGLRGRDIVGELLGELKARGMGACGYYSLVYNNWAFLEHPEWRIEPAGDVSDGSFAGHRYGHCCPNNPGYRDFALAQTAELAGGYDMDGLYFDMTFWPAICLCPHCRGKLHAEEGIEIPQTVNWLDGDWCRFQAARERWITEFAMLLTDAVRAARPRITVNHNFATAMFNWTLGLPFASACAHDFLGADFYGDAVEQLVVSKLMLGLTPNMPLEFQTSRCVNLRDHVRLKSKELMQMQCSAAVLFNSAFMFIDAINIDGTVNDAIFDRIGEIYSTVAPYEPYLGGRQVEDVAIYFSGESKISFEDNGLALKDAPLWSNVYPHVKAVRGAARVLQQAHLPFGIITRKDLGRLDQYKVVILPNVLRMDADECQAMRSYVRNGGRLYASRYTSLTDPAGRRHDDFQLADVFGCHAAGDDLGKVTYVRPAQAAVAQAIAPQDYLSHFGPKGSLSQGAGMIRLARQTAGAVMATLTQTYATTEDTTVFDQKWASIHSLPPWLDTDTPAMVRNSFGAGTAVYSAADIETIECSANDGLLLHIIRDLLHEEPSYSAETHPAVWMNVHHQQESRRFVVGFLNYQAQLPAVAIPRVPFTLRPPAGRRFTSVVMLPDKTPLEFTLDADGTLRAEARDLAVLQVLLATYE